VAEDQTGIPGKFVPLNQTVEDVQAILSGAFDDIEPGRLLYIGSIAEQNEHNQTLHLTVLRRDGILFEGDIEA